MLTQLFHAISLVQRARESDMQNYLAHIDFLKKELGI